MNPRSELPGPPAPEECDPELVAAYTVGEVGPELRDQIAAHLLDCNRCWEQLRISRAVTSAVQQLWEPAPPALKADLRAAILDAGEYGGRAAPRLPRRDIRIAGWLAGVLTAAAVLIGAVTVGGGPDAHPPAVSAAAAPAPIEAALARYATPSPRMPAAPQPAPDLQPVGLHLRTGVLANLAGTAASSFSYDAEQPATHVDVLVADVQWPMPDGATRVGTRGWIATMHGLTVVGGSDSRQEHMLVIASDHARAMTTAATLGII